MAGVPYPPPPPPPYAPQPQPVYQLNPYGYPPPAAPAPKSDSGKVILIIVIVIIAVVAASVFVSVIYVLSTPYGYQPPTRNIGVACVKTNATSYKCAITSADSGLDFLQVGVQLIKSDGTVVGGWNAPLTYNSGRRDCPTPVAPLQTCRAVDNGDGAFGPGDDFYFSPLSGQTLAGLTIKVSGMGAAGSAPLN